jgi:hypothetical protein
MGGGRSADSNESKKHGLLYFFLSHKAVLGHKKPVFAPLRIVDLIPNLDHEVQAKTLH